MNPQASKVTIAMILCGIVSGAGMAANAATPEAAVPSLTVKYAPASLLTDAGARAVYRKIVMAAEEVCPANSGSIIPSGAVQQCRAHSIAAAVMKINNPRLAAIHDRASWRG